MKVPVYHGPDGVVVVVRWRGEDAPRFIRGLREVIEARESALDEAPKKPKKAHTVPPATTAEAVAREEVGIVIPNTVPPPAPPSVHPPRLNVHPAIPDLSDPYAFEVLLDKVPQIVDPTEVVPPVPVRARRRAPVRRTYPDRDKMLRVRWPLLVEGRVLADFMRYKTDNRSGYSQHMRKEAKALLAREKHRKYKGINRLVRDEVRDGLVREINNDWLTHPLAFWKDEPTPKGYLIRVVPCPNQHRFLFFLLDFANRVIVGVHTPGSLNRSREGRGARRREYLNDPGCRRRSRR